jgi:hypothetical protein
MKKFVFITEMIILPAVISWLVILSLFAMDPENVKARVEKIIDEGKTALHETNGRIAIGVSFLSPWICNFCLHPTYRKQGE